MSFVPASWDTAPQRLLLKSDDVDVWRASLNLDASRVRSFLNILAPDELSRANRFHFTKDHDHFVVARGALRTILSRYLETDPASLRFSFNSYGKPALTDDSGGDTLRFNVSHSKNLALFAFTRQRDIGVDIEYLREDFDGLEIAGNYFSPGEVATLRALPAELQRRAFFNCWTRKEAYIKAHGEGLSMPLDEFDVSLAPGETVALLRTAPDPDEAARWSLLELHPGPDYVAALAVEGAGWRLRCWQF